MNESIFARTQLSPPHGGRVNAQAAPAHPRAPRMPSEPIAVTENRTVIRQTPWSSRSAKGTADISAAGIAAVQSVAAPVYEPVVTSTVSQVVVETPPRAQAPSSSACDVALLAILQAPLLYGETAAAGFARKEAELRDVLATLSILESRELHRRLSNPRSGDQLAASFLRLTADRRARLINFVADARRRAALQTK